MRTKRILCFAMSVMIVFSSICLTAQAVENPGNAVVPCATANFSTTIESGTITQGGTPLTLEAEEKVTIKASYTPYSAKLDVGLIDEDGIFHYKSVSNGTIDVTITINTRGSYTFAIRNNAKYSVEVSGYINY